VPDEERVVEPEPAHVAVVAVTHQHRLRRDDLDARFPGLIDLVTAQALDAKTDDPIEQPAR
jgi:hypothetical protein